MNSEIQEISSFGKWPYLFLVFGTHHHPKGFTVCHHRNHQLSSIDDKVKDFLWRILHMPSWPGHDKYRGIGCHYLLRSGCNNWHWGSLRVIISRKETMTQIKTAPVMQSPFMMHLDVFFKQALWLCRVSHILRTVTIFNPSLPVVPGQAGGGSFQSIKKNINL